MISLPNTVTKTIDKNNNVLFIRQHKVEIMKKKKGFSWAYPIHKRVVICLVNLNIGFLNLLIKIFNLHF